MDDESKTARLAIQLGHVGEDALEMRFPPVFADEILSLLDDNGIEHSTAAAFSAGPTDWIETVSVLGAAVGGAGGLAGLAAVISAFMRRHDKKEVEFTVRGQPHKISGYSAADVVAILKDLPEEQARLDAEVRRRAEL